MQPKSTVLTIFTALGILAFSPLSSEARIHSLNTSDKHNNALAQCPKKAQEAFRNKDARFGEAIQFDCENGLLKTLHTAPLAPLSTSWQEFVLSNPEFLGIRTKDIYIDDAYVRVLGQQWHGVRINYTSIGGGPYSYYADGQQLSPFHLTATLVDTRTWHLDTVPKVSSNSAVQSALQIWRVKAPAVEKKVHFTYLEINIEGPAACGTRSGPKLVWSVWGNDDRNASFKCMIDAQTGKPCDPTLCPENSESIAL